MQEQTNSKRPSVRSDHDPFVALENSKAHYPKLGSGKCPTSWIYWKLTNRG